MGICSDKAKNYQPCLVVKPQRIIRHRMEPTSLTQDTRMMAALVHLKRLYMKRVDKVMRIKEALTWNASKSLNKVQQHHPCLLEKAAKNNK